MRFMERYSHGWVGDKEIYTKDNLRQPYRDRLRTERKIRAWYLLFLTPLRQQA
jgi:hypothetical protein